MATNKNSVATLLLPATCPANGAALQARVTGLANAQGKLTQVAAWRLACAHVNATALLACNVKVNIAANPKRGAGALAFAAYGGFTGTRITARAYADKVGSKAAVGHLLWDTLHGFITLYQGNAAVVLPAWCTPGAALPKVKAAKAQRAPRAAKATVAPSVPAAVPLAAQATGAPVGNGSVTAVVNAAATPRTAGAAMGAPVTKA
jgi:hypothetical protein